MKNVMTNGLMLIATIAMMSSSSKRDNFNAGWDYAFGLAGLDVNLSEFAGEDTIDIVMRPQFAKIALRELTVDIEFAFNFFVTGKR
jgi:hypothetical protein